MREPPTYRATRAEIIGLFMLWIFGFISVFLTLAARVGAPPWGLS